LETTYAGSAKLTGLCVEPAYVNRRNNNKRRAAEQRNVLGKENQEGFNVNDNESRRNVETWNGTTHDTTIENNSTSYCWRPSISRRDGETLLVLY
jgi:hypothetical protein